MHLYMIRPVDIYFRMSNWRNTIFVVFCVVRIIRRTVKKLFVILVWIWNIHIYFLAKKIAIQLAAGAAAVLLSSTQATVKPSHPSEGLGTWNQIYGYPELVIKWVYGKLNKAFLKYFEIFFACLMIFFNQNWISILKSIK